VADALSRLLSLLLRGVLLLAGAVLMIGALLFGLAIAVVAVLWSLLRGRRPAPVQFRWRPPGPPGSFGRRPPAPSPGDVVDVQAREIPDADDR
jgi:hypothetical protein